jgi:hypothetical protein
MHFTSRVEGIVGTIISRTKEMGRHALGGVCGALHWLRSIMPEQRTLPQDSQRREFIVPFVVKTLIHLGYCSIIVDAS